MSNKFTGITSAGSAIPVYDKDAHAALSAKLDASALEPAISGKADTSAIPSLDGYATEQWVGEQGYLTEVPAGYATTEDVISATSGLQPSGDYASATDLENYQPVSSMTAFQTVEGMSAYQPAGSYLSANALDSVSGDWNEVSAKLDTTAFSDVSGSFLTSVPDTYLQNTDLTVVDNKITEISGIALSAGDELPSGTMNTSALEYNAANEISGYNGSAIAQYGAEKQWLTHDDTLCHLSNSAQYALGVNVPNVMSASQELLGPVYNKVTFAGYHNGRRVNQIFVSGTWQPTATGQYDNAQFCYTSAIYGKHAWIDPSNSYVYHDDNSNMMTIPWVLGDGRYGGIFVRDGGYLWIRMRDTSNVGWSAFINLKFYAD